jgi:sorbitol/mannitol transport system substrate-binding protein
MLMYRKDLLEEKGLKMPEQPKYEDIKKIADALTDKSKGFYGITLRGKPGWGENMAFLGTLINTFGGTWFDMKWNPTLDTPEWKKAITFYVDLMKADGPPGASANGFNENLTLMTSGKAAMWIDATVAGSMLENPKESQVAGKMGYAPSPIEATPNGSHWLWSWAFAIPKAAKQAEAAEKFAVWATSKDYIKLVAEDVGWAGVPPGTRKSTYDNPEYQKAPFAAPTLQAMQTADPKNPAIKPVPYTGIQFVGIPEFQSFGGVVGQNISGALAGKSTVDQALKESQAAVARAVKQAGYPK